MNCEQERVRLRSKAKGTWICRACSSKMVQLYRIFGTRPPKDGPEVSALEMQAFFRNTHGLSPEQTKAKYKETGNDYVNAEEHFAFDEEFLPLSV